MVRNGEICESIDSLFRLQRDPRFPEGIDYLATAISDLGDPPSCGDSSLELLLQ